MPITLPCCLRQVLLLALGQWDRGQILRRAERSQKFLLKCVIERRRQNIGRMLRDQPEVCLRGDGHPVVTLIHSFISIQP